MRQRRRLLQVLVGSLLVLCCKAVSSPAAEKTARLWFKEDQLGVLSCQLPVLAKDSQAGVRITDTTLRLKMLAMMHYSAWNNSFYIKAVVTTMRESRQKAGDSLLLETPIMLIPVLNDDERKLGHDMKDIRSIALAHSKTKGQVKNATNPPHTGWMLHYATHDGISDNIGILYISGMQLSDRLPTAWKTQPAPSFAHTFRLVSMMQEVCTTQSNRTAPYCVPLRQAIINGTGRFTGGCLLDAKEFVAASTVSMSAGLATGNSNSTLLTATAGKGARSNGQSMKPQTPPRSVWMRPPVSMPQTVPQGLLMVVKPMFGLTVDEVASLLHHHMVFHTTLGATQYVVYDRDPSVLDRLAAHPVLRKWLAGGHLLLVHWSKINISVGDDTSKYLDQRVIHNHALLAYTGQHVMLSVLDLDEYILPWLPEPRKGTTGRGTKATAAPSHSLSLLVEHIRIQAARYLHKQGSPYPRDVSLCVERAAYPTEHHMQKPATAEAMQATDLTIQSLIKLCAPGLVTNIRLQRFNVLASLAYPRRRKQTTYVSERSLWVNASASQTNATVRHPLANYDLVRHHHQSAPKTIVNPNFIRSWRLTSQVLPEHKLVNAQKQKDVCQFWDNLTFHIHEAGSMRGLNATYVHPRCMHMVHVANMLSRRTSSSDRATKFAPTRSIQLVMEALSMT